VRQKGLCSEGVASHTSPESCRAGRAMAELQMIKHRLEPAEIARAALFLASDDCCMITK